MSHPLGAFELDMLVGAENLLVPRAATVLPAHPGHGLGFHLLPEKQQGTRAGNRGVKQAHVRRLLLQFVHEPRRGELPLVNEDAFRMKHDLLVVLWRADQQGCFRSRVSGRPEGRKNGQGEKKKKQTNHNND